MRRLSFRGNAKKATLRSIFISTSLLILSTAIFTTSASADELIVNGGFEEPNLLLLPAGSRGFEKGWTTFFGQNYTGTCSTDIGHECNGDMLIPGWSVVWTDTLDEDLYPEPVPGRVEIQNNTLPDRVNPVLIAAGKTPIEYAKFGEQKAELDSHDRFFENGSVNPDTNVSVFQTFEVCPRAAYKLVYHWKSRTINVGDNDVRVLANDTVVRINKLNTSWQKETVNFVTSDNTESGVAFVSIGDGSTMGMSLDGVSVSGPVPGIDGADCPPPPECPDDDSSDDGSSYWWWGETSDDDSSEWWHEYCDDDSSEECGFCSDDGIAGLTLLYDGNDFSLHGQDEDQVSIVPDDLGLQGYPVSAVIKVYDESGILFSGQVEIGHLFDIENPGDALRIEIIEPLTGELVQTIEFATSCVQPLNKFDEFGGITIWSGESY